MFRCGILRVWLLALLSLAVLGTGSYPPWEWYDGGRGRESLFHGLGLLAFGLVGRFLVVPLLGGLPERHETFAGVVGEFVDRCHSRPAAGAAGPARATAGSPAGVPT